LLSKTGCVSLNQHSLLIAAFKILETKSILIIAMISGGDGLLCFFVWFWLLDNKCERHSRCKMSVCQATSSKIFFSFDTLKESPEKQDFH